MQVRLLSVCAACAVMAFGCATTREEAAATKAPDWKLAPGDLGVVRVEGLEHGTYAVTLLFPNFATLEGAREGASVEVGGALVLFDAYGVLGTLKPKASGELRLWCQGADGSQFRAELPMVIEAAQLSRALQPVGDLQQLGAFVRVVQDSAAEIPVSSGAVFAPSRAALVGDVNADGVPEAWISAASSEGLVCEGAQPNDRAMTLEIPGQRWPLRCCR